MNTKIVLALKESPDFIKELINYTTFMKLPNSKLTMIPENIIHITKFFDFQFNIYICFGNKKISAFKGNIEVLNVANITEDSFDEFICNLIKYCNKPF